MTAIRLPVFETVHEALGFAVTRYETALRLTWLPIALLFLYDVAAPPVFDQAMGAVPSGDAGALGRLGVEAFFFVLVPLLVTALYMAPLVRLAATGEAPDHRTMPTRLGAGYLPFVLGSLASLGGIFVVSTWPLTKALTWLSGFVADLSRREVAVFEEGSLHAVETVPAMSDDALTILEGVPTLAFGLATVFSLYVWLRLFPLPFFWAGKQRGEGWSVLGRTFTASSGTNLFRLAVIALILWCTALVMSGLLEGFTVPFGAYGLDVPGLPELFFGLGLTGAQLLLSGTTALTNAGEPAAWVQTSAVVAAAVFSYAFQVATTALVAGATAGLGGSIVRRMTQG